MTPSPCSALIVLPTWRETSAAIKALRAALKSSNPPAHKASFFDDPHLLEAHAAAVNECLHQMKARISHH
jgi:hypothetical protein